MKERNSLHIFKTELQKFDYLDSLTDFYIESFEESLKSRQVSYKFELSSPEGNILLFGGYLGVVGCSTSAGGTMPYASFAQDLLCTRELLGCNNKDTQKAIDLNNNILGFLIQLDKKGLISSPSIRLNPGDLRSKGKDIFEDLELARLSWASTYALNIEQKFKELWLPKIGKYNNSEILESILIDFS